MPGETWNVGNHLGMGKVWFTVSVSMWDERNVPTIVGTAVNLLAITATFVAPVALPKSRLVTVRTVPSVSCVLIASTCPPSGAERIRCARPSRS